jgi:hypothetical protein
MRYPPFLCLVSALLFLLPGAGRAQPRIRLRIESVQVGFGPSPPIAEFKSGFWTPVYVTVMAGPEGTPPGEIIVESVDSDEVPNRYTAALPQLGPNEQDTILAFTKPGSVSSDITVRARIEDRIVASNESPYAALGLDQQLLLAVGPGLTGLRAALNPAAKAVEDEAPWSRDNAPRRLAVVDDIRMLPNRWFAYESLDLLILSTGNRDFLTALLNEREGRKEAIAEWVRRGGRMLISIGRNQDMVSKLEALQVVLPVSVDDTHQLQRLRSIAKFSGPQYSPLESRPAAKNSAPFVIAKLTPKPGRETETVLSEQDGPSLIVKGAYGLGRVTVVALDLDQQSPFGKWDANARKDFWTTLLRQTAPPLSSQSNGQPMAFNRYGNPQSFDLASQLQMNLEDFEDVPVISFGWVALFILLYILVVGPLDYLFLKKVVKRLELTWITFPTVVITISVAAYFTAYWLKGNDQKVNKIDLVDIDLHTQQIYGNTWFTIFSPRIQHYTIGLTTTAPEWVSAAQSGAANTSVVLSWMARPEMGYGGTGRAQSQGLFRRAYDYLPDANGLVGVPIQVWSTKSFAASWQAPLDRSRPLISADLRHSQEKSSLLGQITSRLPVALDDVVIYSGSGADAKWYSLGRLVQDVPVPVANIHAAGRQAMPMEEWLSTAPMKASLNASPSRIRYSNVPSEATTTIIKKLLFPEFDRSSRRDSALRHLDQGWRLRHKDEVLLFGRIAREEGQAEALTMAGTSPSRLWLGSLPAIGQSRPPLSGTLAQETYVRMIVPVRTSE